MELDQAFVINGDDLRIVLGGMDGAAPMVPDSREATEYIIGKIAQPVGKAGIRVTADRLAVALAYVHNVLGDLASRHAKVGPDRLAAELLDHIAEHLGPKGDPWASGDEVVDAHICCEHADGPGPFADPEVAAMAALAPALAAVRRLKHDEAKRVMRWATRRATENLPPF